MSTPTRTCTGCGSKREKGLLWRLVLDAERQLHLDLRQRAPGRGAYLCGPDCAASALKRRALHRALKATGELRKLDLPPRKC
ncbi:MAG: YlxR family protein [Archangium sp.]|nr:YlxR family protein [Archangium sp.]